jgi:vacuolar-type H+-ATPase subunit I/STV1
MDYQKGDLVYYKEDISKIEDVSALRNSVKVEGSWTSTDNVERVFKFRKGEKVFVKVSGRWTDTKIDRILKECDGHRYLVYYETHEVYDILTEESIHKRKAIEDLDEGDSFIDTESGKTITIVVKIWDDYVGKFKFLLKDQETGNIFIKTMSQLKTWNVR